jgi:hypothetical protein
MSASEDAACFRLYAVYCAEIAQATTEPGRKVALLDMAQAWAKLANQLNGTGDARAVCGTAAPGLSGGAKL